MARADGGADGPAGGFGEAKVGARFKLHHAATAAGRHLERGTKNRARVAPARWSPADCGRGRRHRVLRGAIGSTCHDVPPFNPRRWRKRRSAAAVVVNNNPKTMGPPIRNFGSLLSESAGRATAPSTSCAPTAL